MHDLNGVALVKLRLGISGLRYDFPVEFDPEAATV